MKRFISYLLVAIVVCGLTLQTSGQENGKTSKTETAEATRLNLHTPQAKIKDVLAEINKFFAKEGQSFNAILSPEVLDLVVPPLEMRNVTATDALMLIAAATDIRVQPVASLDGRPIGLKFEKRDSAAPYALPIPATSDASQLRPPTAGNPPPTGRTISYPTPSAPQTENSLRTEVYPISSIGGKESLMPIIEHLQEMLYPDYSSNIRDAIKISVHEKTGVLVFRAPESAHKLLASYLQAYMQNARYKEREPQEKLGRELAALKAKLETLVAENEKMKAAAREAEERAHKLQSQLKDSQK